MIIWKYICKKTAKHAVCELSFCGYWKKNVGTTPDNFPRMVCVLPVSLFSFPLLSGLLGCADVKALVGRLTGQGELRGGRGVGPGVHPHGTLLVPQVAVRTGKNGFGGNDLCARASRAVPFCNLFALLCCK